jgi:hypothetical protein
MILLVEEINFVKGWVGKPIGARQVLMEQELLDPQVTYVSNIKRMGQIMMKKWNTAQFLQTLLISETRRPH